MATPLGCINPDCPICVDEPVNDDEEGVEFPPLDEMFMKPGLRVWFGDEEYVVTQMDVNTGTYFNEVNVRLRRVFRLPR